MSESLTYYQILARGPAPDPGPFIHREDVWSRKDRDRAVNAAFRDGATSVLIVRLAVTTEDAFTVVVDS